MSLSSNLLKAKIEANMKADFCEITEIFGLCDTSFDAVVVSEEFEGKSRIQQHRQVQNILSEELKNIHAFTIKTYTPEKWEKQKETN